MKEARSSDNEKLNSDHGAKAGPSSHTEVENEENQSEYEKVLEGMDPEGYSGPSKVVKPLTPEALAAYKAAQDRAGIIYISRIPPGMQPAKVRHLMSAHGEVGRVYLQREGVCHSGI
jgi:ESF2/ABP1 family protein